MSVGLTETCMHTFIGDLLNKHSVVIDLGANQGQFSMYMISTFGCSTVAVEPVPYLFANLPKNEQLTAINACIHSEERYVQLNLSTSACASIYANAHIEQNETIEVQGITVDSLLQRIGIRNVDLLKVDIEGAELDLFENLTNESLKQFGQITVEFHDFMWPEMKPRVEMIKKKIVKAGFYVIPFSNNNGDVLFIQKRLLPYIHYLYLKYPIKYLRGFHRLLNKHYKTKI